MNLERINRWTWAAAGTAIGLGIGLLRQADSAGDFVRYGECLASQRRFEQALVWEAGGRKALDGLVVFPEQVQSLDGRLRSLHIVAGDLAQTPRGPQGSAPGQRKRVFYVAEVPYTPLSPTTTLAGGGSVRSYLDGLKPQGVSYRYAWWRETRWSVPLWTVGGLVIVGGVWPTVITLIVYGTLRRPKEQPGIDLRNARPSQPNAPPASPAEVDLSPYQADEASTPAAAGSHSAPPAVPPTIPVRPLAPAALESNTCSTTEPAAEFDRDSDEFYPTDRRLHRRSPPPAREPSASPRGRPSEPSLNDQPYETG